MKTLISHFFGKTINQQPLRTWRHGLLLLSQSWLRELRFKMRAERMKRKESSTSNNSSSVNSSNSQILQTLIRTALADQVGAVSNLKDVTKAFPRIFVGLVCLMVLAPYADVFYTRLDFNSRVSADVWYYESYHWLFLCLGPYLKSIFFTVGLYLVFARGSSILSVIAAYALMYDIGKVFWLLQVTNHEEYKSLPTGWFLAYGFITGCFIVFLADRLTYWLNHRVMAIKARLQGLRNIADKADPQMIVSGFVKTMDDDVMVQQFKQY